MRDSSSRRLTLLTVAICVVALVLVVDASALVLGRSAQPRIVTLTTTYTLGGSHGSGGGAVIVIPFYTGQGYGNFDPENITVVVGVNNTVTWINEDQTAEHDVQFDTWPAGANVPANPSEPIPYGDGYTVTLTVPGTYTYECEFHYWMEGTIQVKA